jgi:hypothetical protein
MSLHPTRPAAKRVDIALFRDVRPNALSRIIARGLFVGCGQIVIYFIALLWRTVKRAVLALGVSYGDAAAIIASSTR